MVFSLTSRLCELCILANHAPHSLRGFLSSCLHSRLQPAAGNNDETGRPANQLPHDLTQRTLHRTPLLHTRRYRCSHPLTKLTARFTPRPLRDVTVNHHKTNRVLRQVVCRCDARLSDKRNTSHPARGTASSCSHRASYLDLINPHATPRFSPTTSKTGTAPYYTRPDDDRR